MNELGSSEIFLYSQVALCMFGLITNLLNIIVYFNINKRTKIQNINIIWSILDFLILLLGTFILIVHITNPDSLLSKILELYIDMYLTSCMAITIICIRIFVFTRHYLLIKRKDMLFIKAPINLFTYLKIFSCIGLVIYLPVIFMWKITEKNNSSEETIYTIVKTNVEAGVLGEIFSLVITGIRCSVSFVLMIMLNMMIYVKYKKVLFFSKSE